MSPTCLPDSPPTDLQESWLIQTLAFRAPLLADWMLERLRITRQSVRRAVEEGLVHVYQLPVITPLNVTGPVYRWSPGQPLPEDGQDISAQLRGRWSGPAGHPSLHLLAAGSPTERDPQGNLLQGHARAAVHGRHGLARVDPL